MSRIPLLSKNEKQRVVVGWDNPFETFFAQVEEDNTYVFFIGYKPMEITSVDDLAQKINDYADIPPAVRHRLQKEYDNRTKPYPLQKMVGEMMERS